MSGTPPSGPPTGGALEIDDEDRTGGELSIDDDLPTSDDWDAAIGPTEMVNKITQARLRRHVRLGQADYAQHLAPSFTTSSNRLKAGADFGTFLAFYQAQIKEFNGVKISDALKQEVIELLEGNDGTVGEFENSANIGLGRALQRLGASQTPPVDLLSYVRSLMNTQYARNNLSIIESLDSGFSDPDSDLWSRLSADTYRKQLVALIKNANFFSGVNMTLDQKGDDKHPKTDFEITGPNGEMLVKGETQDQGPYKGLMLVSMGKGKDALMHFMHFMIAQMEKSQDNTFNIVPGKNMEKNVMIYMAAVCKYNARVTKDAIQDLIDKAIAKWGPPNNESPYYADHKQNLLYTQMLWLQKHGETFSARFNPSPDSHYGSVVIDSQYTRPANPGFLGQAMNIQQIKEHHAEQFRQFNEELARLGAAPAPTP